MQKPINRRLVFFVSFFLLLLPCSVNAQLRIVSYNTTPTINPGLAAVLEAIGNETVNGIQRPIDILGLQEQPSHRVETQAIVDLLNSIYGEGVYARGDLTGAGFFTQGVVYNTESVQLIAEKRVGTTSFNGAPRQGLRYQFRPIGYENESDFYIYNSHFKASDTDVDAARRAVEASMLRADAETLGPEAAVIYLGDFNLYRNTEVAFQTLTAAGIGQAFDPVEQVGRWHASNRYRRFHTQSTTLAGGENRAGGGVDDRFDFQLVTSSLMNGEGISYIGPNVPNAMETPARHSYRVFGNNGTHFTSRNISTGTGASPAILDALESASDHLPVVVDYQIPAVMQVSENVPQRVMVGSQASGIVSVANIANVQQRIAADELNYSIASVSSVDVNAVGEAIAMEPAIQHSILLDTASIGQINASLVVSAEEPATANRLQSITFDYAVVGRSNPSFADQIDLDELLIDLGEFNRDDIAEPIPFQFDLYNFGDPNTLTADLVVPAFSVDDQGLQLFFPETLIAAGQSTNFAGAVELPATGDIDIEFSINASDEAIPGSSAHAPLTVRIVGWESNTLVGDFDGDQRLAPADIDALSAAIRMATDDPAFDLNLDGQVDSRDREYWVIQLADSFFGDSNLDGEFNSVDLINVFQANEFRDAIVGNSTWISGDWDGDAEVDSSDLILAFQQGGYENGPRTTRSIPEPCGLEWVVFWGTVLIRNSNRRVRSIE